MDDMLGERIHAIEGTVNARLLAARTEILGHHLYVEHHRQRQYPTMPPPRSIARSMSEAASAPDLATASGQQRALARLAKSIYANNAVGSGKSAVPPRSLVRDAWTLAYESTSVKWKVPMLSPLTVVRCQLIAPNHCLGYLRLQFAHVPPSDVEFGGGCDGAKIRKR